MRLRPITIALIALAPTASAQSPALPIYADHTRLLVVRDAKGVDRPVTSAADWAVRRSQIVGNFEAVAGPLPGPERRVPLDVERGESVTADGVTRTRLTFAVEPGDRVPAWLLVPARRPDGRRAPGVLCLHQTTAIGKDEPVGLGGLPNLAYAKELAARGYVAIVPDYPNFGTYRVDPYALGYASATMKGIWNHLRAVDLLVSLPEVDPTRIAAIGHSLGGHNAIFVALFDDRIKAVVTSCGFNAFPQYHGGNIAGWSHAGYMPRLRSVYGLDLAKVPFDFPELLAALAPRAVFINAPTRDANFARIGMDACLDAARPVFTLLDAGGNLVDAKPDAEHDFPVTTRRDSYEFLDRAIGAWK